jgi:PPOX class probable F420-dependent enzyme
VSSRRAQIAMTAEEVAAFLDEQRVVTCATLGRDGWPHLMPLWYVLREGEVWAWTYAKSQKVRNLERDARCTLQVETGSEYHELRGVMIKAEAVIHREHVLELGVEIFERYTGGPVDPEHLKAQATKRVGLQFVVRSVASWDHRKLGGVY